MTYNDEGHPLALTKLKHANGKITYRVDLGGAVVSLTATQLLSHARFRAAVFKQTFRLISPVKPKDWEPGGFGWSSSLRRRSVASIRSASVALPPCKASRLFQRPLPLPKSLRNSFARRLPIIPKRRTCRCWRSPFRTLRNTGKYSWNFHLGLKMKSAGPAPRRGLRVGRQIAPSTRSVTVSDGTRSNTDQSCWDYPGPFRMSFASSPRRTFKPGLFPNHCQRRGN
jgi:hypothetical protein